MEYWSTGCRHTPVTSVNMKQQDVSAAGSSFSGDWVLVSGSALLADGGSSAA